MSRVEFRYERLFPHPIEKVWAAITDPSEIEQWSGMRMEIDLRVGGRYVSTHSSGDRVEDRIVRLDPPRLLEHTWWEEINPSALVTWELRPADDGSGGCVLTLTHALEEDDVRAAAAKFGTPDAWQEMLSRNEAGWARLLDQLGERLG